MLNCSWGQKKYMLYIIPGSKDPPNNLSKINCSVASQLSNTWNLLRGHVQMTFLYTNQTVTDKIWDYISIYLGWPFGPRKRSSYATCTQQWDFLSADIQKLHWILAWNTLNNTGNLLFMQLLLIVLKKSKFRLVQMIMTSFLNTY